MTKNEELELEKQMVLLKVDEQVIFNLLIRKDLTTPEEIEELRGKVKQKPWARRALEDLRARSEAFDYDDMEDIVNSRKRQNVDAFFKGLSKFTPKTDTQNDGGDTYG